MSNDDGFHMVKIYFDSLKFTKIIQSSLFFTIKLISRLIQSYHSHHLIISKLLPGYIMGVLYLRLPGQREFCFISPI